MKKISESITLRSDDVSCLEEYSSSELQLFKYAPITSVDVERSFSMYVRQNRQSFTFDNLVKNMFVYINKNLSN